MRVRLTALFFCALILPVAGMPARAAEVLAVGDPSRPYHDAFMQGFNESGAPAGLHSTEVATSSINIMSSAALAKFDVIVTMGAEAARKIVALDPPVPVIHALVSEDLAESLEVSNVKVTARSTTLVLEQPIARMLELAFVSLPDRKRLGVIYGPESYRLAPEVRKQAEVRGYTLVEKHISDDGGVGIALQGMVGQIDLLLALPDREVVNPNTAKSLILDSYLHDIALIGYSHALVKAGALMAVHSTPQQFGQQAAELVLQNEHASTEIPKIVYPRFYQVTVNYQVARALGIELPTEDVLMARLHRSEVAQ